MGGYLASLVLHALLASILLFFSKRENKPDNSTQEVSVEIVFPASSDLSISSTPSVLPEEDITETPDSAQTTPDVSSSSTIEPPPEPIEELETSELPPEEVMIPAQQILSTKILLNPRSRNTRKLLRQLLPEERILQICNLEAMAQISAWSKDLKPDLLLPHIKSETKLVGQLFEVSGGALRSKRRWYNVKYTCEVSEDMEKITEFSFFVGEEIPLSEWEKYELSEEDVHD